LHIALADFSALPLYPQWDLSAVNDSHFQPLRKPKFAFAEDRSHLPDNR
jgi:hypothetical protein